MADNKKIEDYINKEEYKKSFSVPDNYFEDFSSKMNNKIKEENTGNNKKMNFIKIAATQLKFAAIFIGFVAVAYFIVNTVLNNKTIESKQLTNQETFSYIEVKQSELIDYIAKESDTTEIDTANSDEIMNYLVDNEIDYNSIIEEL